MKNLFILFVAVASMSVSCTFLDEYNPNKVTQGNFYESEADIKTSLTGVYESLTQDYYFKNNHYFTDVRANATVVVSSGANSGIPYQFYNYTLTEENTYVYNRYSQLYKTIDRVNTLLKHLDDVTYGSKDARKIYEAECRFVRSLTYFYLVTEWGDVPLVLKDLTSTEEVAAANYRCPKADVYNAIMEDLKYVISSPLADIQPISECGRASKLAAYALLGKVYLQRARDEDFEATAAKDLSEAVSNLTTAWSMKPFTELSDIDFSDIWNLETQKSCPENIFQVNYIQGNESLGSSWSYMYGPLVTGITSKKAGQIENVTTLEVYNKYEEVDIRKEFLKSTVSAGLTYYHTMKYVDLECGENGYAGNNWVVLRFADVVLMLAEAAYWQGDPTTAVKWLNIVRERAGLHGWSGSDLRQGIYDERLREFMQEGHRWQDVNRMYTDEEMVEHFSSINVNFSKQDLLLPIPYNERILNPEGLYQNFGY